MSRFGQSNHWPVILQYWIVRCCSSHNVEVEAGNIFNLSKGLSSFSAKIKLTINRALAGTDYKE